MLLGDDDADDELLDDVDDEHLGGLVRAGLPVVAPQVPSTGLQRLRAQRFARLAVSPGLAALVARSRQPATNDKYEAAWADFAGWLVHARRLEDPTMASALDVGEYVTHLVACGLAYSTIEGRMAAISHAFAQLDRWPPTRDPIVRDALAGAAVTLGRRQRQAAPLLLDDMRQLVRRLPIVHANRPTMRRDQLLVALGWASALRESELLALDAEHLHFTGDPDQPGVGGLAIEIPRSKTDPTGRGQWVAIPWATHWATCPARLALAHVKRQPDGPLFRHIDRHGHTHGRLRPGSALTERLRLLAAQVLLDPEADRYSSHSLRAGFATSAEDAGADPTLVARHLRHKPRNQRSRDMRQIYDRPTSLFARTPFDPSWW